MLAICHCVLIFSIKLNLNLKDGFFRMAGESGLQSILICTLVDQKP